MSEITRGVTGMPFVIAMDSQQIHAAEQGLLAFSERLRSDCASIPTFNPDWDRLEAAQESLREHMEIIIQLKAENEALRKVAGDVSAELYKACGWICREVEAGTKSATHWAIRLGNNAKAIEAVLAGEGK